MSGASPARRIVANLDLETELLREEASRLRRKPASALPRRVLATLSSLGTLLRALVEEEDHLWTPLPVDPRRMAKAAGLPVPVLETGPLEGLPAALETLAWGIDRRVEALTGAGGWRPATGGASPQSAVRQAAGGGEGNGRLGALLREGEPAPSEAVRAAAHRSFALEAARALGAALPGARLLGSLEDLEAHLRSGGAEAAPGSRWVLKAPLSAAGRLRLRGAGAALSAAERDRARDLFALGGTLLFEPWMDRTADFGFLGLVTGTACRHAGGGETRLLGPHRLEVKAGGTFQGIVLAPEASMLGLSAPEAEALERTAAGVGERLSLIGYRGPFGIDAFRHRRRDGQAAFHPLAEVNPRMTFGLLARAIAERIPGGSAGPLRLRVGVAADLEEASGASGVLVPLLLPAPEEPTAAWLER